MSKKLPIGKFRCADKLSIYTEQAIKMYDEIMTMVQYLK